VDLDGVTYSEELNLFVIVGYGGTVLYTTFSDEENLIQNITANSDMNLNLQIGQNQFQALRSSGNLRCRITFRQKYLGV
jgi:hypothetical protein